MILYEFETKEMNISEGYTRLQVRDGKVKFEGEPTPEEQALCEKYGGVLAADDDPKPAKKETKKAAKSADKAETKAGK